MRRDLDWALAPLEDQEIDEEQLRNLYGDCGFESVDLDSQQPSQQILGMIPESVARENLIVPLSLSGDSLVIAIPPESVGKCELIDKLRFILNCEIRTCIASRDSIRRAIERYYPA